MGPLIGEIRLLPYNFTPNRWEACEGQVLQISQYAALFSLLGTNHGGDGVRNFGLPDLRGKEPAPNLRYFIALDGEFPARP